MTETQLKQNIAKNIAALRKQHNVTQADLAVRLSYSDKSVSKWERGEGLPDVYVLTRIADMFGVTVNELVSDGDPTLALGSAEQERDTTASPKSRIFIALLSGGLVWFVAALAFFILNVACPNFASWLVFLYAIPVSAIVMTVFSHLWWGQILRGGSVSVLVWGIALSVHLTCSAVGVSGLSPIYVAAGAFEVLVLLWYSYLYFRSGKAAAKEGQAKTEQADTAAPQTENAEESES